MSFALSLGVADGGARLLIGDQASDQDWVLNVPETTDKGTSQQPLLKFPVGLCKSVGYTRLPEPRHTPPDPLVEPSTSARAVIER